MAAFAVRHDVKTGTRVNPEPVPDDLVELVARIQRVAWPLWPESRPRMLRELAELCRLQAARGLTVLSWLADGGSPGDVSWLLPTRRLTGRRQQNMYAAAASVPDPVHELVFANWTWVLASAHGARVVAPFFASRAYPDDGYAAANATIAMLGVWDRHADVRPALAAAWAATRTPADWCKAGELRAAYGTHAPVFTYPRTAFRPTPGLRPWIGRLLRCGRDHG